MFSFIFRRFLNIIPILIVASMLVFSLIHFIPGNPAAVMLGPAATDVEVERLTVEMGLDQPIYIQYGIWFTEAIKGNLGDSIFFHQPVLNIIKSRAETSLFIAAISLIIVMFIGVPIGIISAAKHNTWLDQISLGVAMFGAAIPTFWLGLMMMLVFAATFNWLPSSGFPGVLESRNLLNLRYLILPCITLAAPNSALIIRLSRSSMLDVLTNDYIRTARSKGLSERVVVLKHAFRNALISITSVLGFTFAGLISGTVVTEEVFSLPGVGRLVVQSILRRDYPVIQGVLLIIVIVFMLMNLLTDIGYGIWDPRIRYE